MLGRSPRLTAAVGLAAVITLATPALAVAHSSHGTAVGLNNVSGARAVHAAAPVAVRAVQPAAAHAFPSSSSTVIGSVGFINDTEVGYFWSASRGDSVEQTFGGPGHVKKMVLKLDVVENSLAGSNCDWAVSINGTDVGTFTVTPGQTGNFTEKYKFAKMTGGNYDVKIRVTNEVPAGDGSITLAYAGDGAHSVTLKKK